MKILPKYAGRFVVAEESREDEAVEGLRASLRSSDSLKGILDRAKGRCEKRQGMDGQTLHAIEGICRRYEAHQKAVRDHCLDFYNSVPERRVQPDLSGRTDELLREGSQLYDELRSAILSSY